MRALLLASLILITGWLAGANAQVRPQPSAGGVAKESWSQEAPTPNLHSRGLTSNMF